MFTLEGLYTHIDMNPYKRMACLLFIEYEKSMCNCMLFRMKYILWMIYLEEGAEQEPAGGGRRWNLHYEYICIYLYYSEEGAEWEPAEGGRRWQLHLFLFCAKYDSDKLK